MLRPWSDTAVVLVEASWCCFAARANAPAQAPGERWPCRPSTQPRPSGVSWMPGRNVAPQAPARARECMPEAAAWHWLLCREALVQCAARPRAVRAQCGVWRDGPPAPWRCSPTAQHAMLCRESGGRSSPSWRQRAGRRLPPGPPPQTPLPERRHQTPPLGRSRRLSSSRRSGTLTSMDCIGNALQAEPTLRHAYLLWRCLSLR